MVDKTKTYVEKSAKNEPLINEQLLCAGSPPGPGWPLAWPWLAFGLALTGPWPGSGWPLAWPLAGLVQTSSGSNQFQFKPVLVQTSSVQAVPVRFSALHTQARRSRAARRGRGKRVPRGYEKRPRQHHPPPSTIPVRLQRLCPAAN